VGRKTLFTIGSSGVLLVLAMVVLTASNAGTPKSTESFCKMSSLAITQTASGGLGHSWIILEFRNSSDATCKLVGYPSVKVLLGSSSFSNQNGAAKQSKPGAFMVAVDSRSIYGGGGLPANSPLPVVSLRPHSGSASSVIGWSPEGGGKACPWFASLTLGLDGGHELLSDGPAMLCTSVSVTPIVPGTLGQWDASS
jgi:hypothetical protein